MFVSRAFTPRPSRKASSVSPEGRLASVADRLHSRYGSYLACKSCALSGRDRKGNYIKNVAGKRDREDRYYRRWCCTTNGKFSCPSLSNTVYIDWAKTQLSRNNFRSVVETIRGTFEDKGPEHCQLGLLLQDGPSPSTRPTLLKRKVAAVQATPLPTKRQLHFFELRDVVLPTTNRSLYPKDKEAYVTPALSTLDAGKVDLVRLPHLGMIAYLVKIQARLDQVIATYSGEDLSRQQEDKKTDSDKTRENSLSPNEYLGIHKAKDLALHATARPITPPNQSSPLRPQLTCLGTFVEIPPLSSHDIDPLLPAVEKDLLPVSLAATLAADFHSANASKKKEIRIRAKQENVVAAFEEEIRRIGTLARALA